MKICCYNDGAPGLIEDGSIYPLNDALAEAGLVRARASMAEVIDALANQSAAAAAVARARQGKPVAAASARLLAPIENPPAIWAAAANYRAHQTEMIERIGRHDDKLADPGSEKSRQPEYTKNAARAIKPEYLVLLGVCTHLGCLPQNRFAAGASTDGVLTADWPGGFFCPCHGSKFDLSGRVFAGVPAPTNLEIPPYSFTDDAHIVIGLDQAENA